jgi:hypothetical protein
MEVNGKSAGFCASESESFGDAERVIDPFSRALQPKAAIDFFGSVEAVAGQLDATIGQAIASGGDSQLQSGGEDNTSVVIRVIPENLDAAWSE